MKNKKTYYLLVLDRSGSMQDCVGETISGFNEQVQMIRDLQKKYPEQEFHVSLCLFNHDVDQVFEKVNVKSVKELTKHSYIPDGSTALLDAIGESVHKLKYSIEGEIERDEATAIVVILTDGHENASKVYSHENVRNLIRDLEKSASWSFSFLGATLDAVNVAESMNISRKNSAVYSKGKTVELFRMMSNSMDHYAEAKERNVKEKDFLKEESGDI